MYVFDGEVGSHKFMILQEAMHCEWCRVCDLGTDALDGWPCVRLAVS